MCRKSAAREPSPPPLPRKCGRAGTLRPARKSTVPGKGGRWRVRSTWPRTVGIRQRTSATGPWRGFLKPLRNTEHRRQSTDTDAAIIPHSSAFRTLHSLRRGSRKFLRDERCSLPWARSGNGVRCPVVGPPRRLFELSGELEQGSLVADASGEPPAASDRGRGIEPNRFSAEQRHGRCLTRLCKRS